MTIEDYLKDSYLTESKARIVEINGDKVILDQTIFYATGGGQENDIGFLCQNNNCLEVYDVKKESGTIVHYVKNGKELVIDEVTLKINWERRYGLMRHHSCLHVIGAVVYKKYGALSTGNKIYPDRARIDFNELNDLTDTEIDEIINESNRIIEENHPITTRYINRKEAESSSGLIKTVISLLPPSVTTVRLVAIEGIDEQACGGTHVKETKEIGKMFLTKFTSKGKNNKRFEVYAENILNPCK